MGQTFRINKTQLERGTKIERKEHPWATVKIARRIATDHIVEHPRSYPQRKRKP